MVSKDRKENKDPSRGKQLVGKKKSQAKCSGKKKNPNHTEPSALSRRSACGRGRTLGSGRINVQREQVPDTFEEVADIAPYSRLLRYQQLETYQETNAAEEPEGERERVSEDGNAADFSDLVAWYGAQIEREMDVNGIFWLPDYLIDNSQIGDSVVAEAIDETRTNSPQSENSTVCMEFPEWEEDEDIQMIEPLSSRNDIAMDVSEPNEFIDNVPVVAPRALMDDMRNYILDETERVTKFNVNYEPEDQATGNWTNGSSGSGIVYPQYSKSKAFDMDEFLNAPITDETMIPSEMSRRVLDGELTEADEAYLERFSKLRHGSSYQHENRQKKR